MEVERVVVDASADVDIYGEKEHGGPIGVDGAEESTVVYVSG